MSDMTGRNLGPYRILEQLGQGGMATVYKAYQPSMDRYVAIKVLPSHFAQDPTFVGRFEQEAKVIARLEHARILPVYDYGEQEGITYIVMRYLDAGTLSDRLRMGPLSLEEMARIIAQVGEGLDYAHKRGIIHRDIKPANIMLDASGDVYLTDFGISKLVEGTAQFTGSGIVGTPAYVSPEQGLGRPIDYRSDIYSLGVVLYQMAVGDVPYHAETPMAVVIKHIYEPLPLPRQLKPDLPEVIELVILRAMAKEPDERFQSCGEMAQALQRAVTEVTAPVPSYEMPTQPSTGTEALVTPVQAARTMASPVPMAEGAETVPLAASAPAEEEVGTAPRARRPGRALPVALGVVIVVALLAVAALVFKDRWIGLIQPTGVAESQPQPTATQRPTQQPTQQEPQVSPTEEQPPLEEVPSELACDQSQVLTMALGFERQDFGLRDLSVEARRRLSLGEGMLTIQPGGNEDGFGLPLGPEMRDSSFKALAVLPNPSSTVVLGSRLSAERVLYVVAIQANGEAHLFRRAGQEVAAGQAGKTLDDGRVHLIELFTKGEFVMLRVDGQNLVEYVDPDPLPPGRFWLGAQGSQVRLDALMICQFGGEVAPSGPSILFADGFDQAQINPAWLTIYRPEDLGLSDGVLKTAVMPYSSVAEEAAENSLQMVVAAPNAPIYSVAVDVDVHPFQNFQMAGLIALGQGNRPLFTLGRAYCDLADRCQGDAIYLDNWTSSVSGEDYRPPVAGGGEMPPEGFVTLRLVIDGRVAAGFYSLDGGKTWRGVGEWPIPPDKTVSYIGVVAAGGAGATQPAPVAFDNFRVTNEGAP